MFTFTLESTHFVFNKCPIYTHDDASVKFSTSWDETGYNVPYPKWLRKYEIRQDDRQDTQIFPIILEEYKNCVCFVLI